MAFPAATADSAGFIGTGDGFFLVLTVTWIILREEEHPCNAGKRFLAHGRGPGRRQDRETQDAKTQGQAALFTRLAAEEPPHAEDANLLNEAIDTWLPVSPPDPPWPAETRVEMP